jgi:hypothetical protein
VKRRGNDDSLAWFVGGEGEAVHDGGGGREGWR